MGILARISEARSGGLAEMNAAFLAGEDFTGYSTRSGEVVSPSNALRITTVYKCVDFISKTMATVPLQMFKRIPGGREAAPEYSLQRVINMQPNPIMTAIDYRRLLWGNFLLWGNHYAQIVRNNADEVVELWPMRPDAMENPKRVGRDVIYKYHMPDGTTREYRKRDIFNLLDLSHDGLVGLSKIRQAMEMLGIAKATEGYGAKFFKNGVRPTGVMQHPAKLSDKAFDRLKESIKGNAGGENQSGILIAEEGMTWQSIGIPPNEAQFIETKGYSDGDIAGLFGVKPHKVGIMENATYSNIEHQNIESVQDTMLPLAVYLEQKISIDLIPREDQNIYFAKHNLDGLLRGDSESRAALYSSMFNVGALSPNEIRELEDRNSYPGGDEHFVQLNMIPVSKIDDVAYMNPQGNAENSDDDNSDDNADDNTDETNSQKTEIETRQMRSIANRSRLVKVNKRLFSDAVSRIVNKEDKALKRAVEKYLRNGMVLDFRLWLKKYYEDMPPSIERNMLGVFMAHAETMQYEANSEIGKEPSMTPELQAFVRDYNNVYAYNYIQSSQRQIEKIVEETDVTLVADAVLTRVNEWGETRADKEADRQSVEAASAVVKFVFLAGGITMIRWVAVGESCPYCNALNGKIIGIESNFIGKQESLDPEGGKGPMKSYQNKSHPPLHRGCDCTISSVINN